MMVQAGTPCDDLGVPLTPEEVASELRVRHMTLAQVLAMSTMEPAPLTADERRSARGRPAPPPIPVAVLSPVSAELAAQRLAACAGCDRYRPASDRCGMCGCSDTVSRRSTSPVAPCPAGRWPITASSLLPSPGVPDL